MPMSPIYQFDARVITGISQGFG